MKIPAGQPGMIKRAIVASAIMRARSEIGTALQTCEYLDALESEQHESRELAASLYANLNTIVERVLVSIKGDLESVGRSREELFMYAEGVQRYRRLRETIRDLLAGHPARAIEAANIVASVDVFPPHNSHSSFMVYLTYWQFDGFVEGTHHDWEVTSRLSTIPPHPVNYIFHRQYEEIDDAILKLLGMRLGIKRRAARPMLREFSRACLLAWILRDFRHNEHDWWEDIDKLDSPTSPALLREPPRRFRRHASGTPSKSSVEDEKPS